MIIKKKKQKADILTEKPQQVEEKIVEVQSVVSGENQAQVKEVVETPKIVEPQPPEVDLFDIENIDFTQRQERRRGSRRRGYRRIDDRNLVSRAQEESETIKSLLLKKGIELALKKLNRICKLLETIYLNL